VIGGYLSRYICRVGISDNRVAYDASSGQVQLEFKDHRKQQAGQAAPPAYRNRPSLVVMAGILRHVLPAYFSFAAAYGGQRSRHYGPHAHSTYQRVKASIPMAVRQKEGGIRLLFLLLKPMLRVKVTARERCGSPHPAIRELVYPDGNYTKGIAGSRPHAPPSGRPEAVGEANTRVT